MTRPSSHIRKLIRIDSAAIPDKDAVTIRMTWEDAWIFPGPAMGKNPDDWQKHMQEVIATTFDGVVPQ